MFFKRVTRLITISLATSSVLMATANDLSPKYIKFKTNDSGTGIWQMMGVAGFYNNIYGIDYQEKGNLSPDYTIFYCDEPIEGSTIRTTTGSNYDSGMTKRPWLFSVKVEKNIVDSLPLVIHIDESNITCDKIGLYGSSNLTVINDVRIFNSEYDRNTSNTFIEIRYPDAMRTYSNLVFSLGYDMNDSNNTIYELKLQDFKNSAVGVVKGIDLNYSTNQDYYTNMSVAKRKISDVVDLYLNDNPGFGNSTRSAGEYISLNHQLPIDQTNFITDNSELKLYNYNSKNNRWEIYNSKNNDLSNNFTEVQAGKGYWVKYDFKGVNTNTFVDTIEVNSSCPKDCNGNGTLTIKAPSGTDKNYTITDGNISSIVKAINGSDINNSEVNLTAFQPAGKSSSFVVIAQSTSSDKPTFSETITTGIDVFPYITSSDKSMSNTKEIKSGFVLGDTSVQLTSHEVYRDLKVGWHLMTLPNSKIRKSVTGLIVDFSNLRTDINISDEFGVNIVNVTNAIITNNHEFAKSVNKAIEYAQANGDLSSQFFNVRVLPIGTDKLMFISSEKFKIASTVTFSGTNLVSETTDLRGDSIFMNSNQTAIAGYGQYALLIQPNLDSKFVQDGFASIQINGESITLSNNSDINSVINQINIKGVNAYQVDFDMNESDNKDYILLTSKSGIYVKDTTYTKVYSYTPKTQSTIDISLFVGSTDETGKKDTINLDANKTFTSYGKAKDLNISKVTSTYILDENGSVYNNIGSEYIVMASKDPIFYLFESAGAGVNVDSLKAENNWDKNSSVFGALLTGIQGSDLSSLPINENGSLDSSQLLLTDLSSNTLVTDDILASNTLTDLINKAFKKQYIPTMIIGSESNINNGLVSWQQISPIEKVSKWYEKYNLFSINNQKSYWVYLDQYPALGNAISVIPNGEVTKRYVRYFDNEANTTTNYIKLDNVGVTLDGIYDKDNLKVMAQLTGFTSLDLTNFEMTQGGFTGSSTSYDYSTQIATELLEETYNATSVKIIVTDGRLYTVEKDINFDVIKPKKPSLSFDVNDPTILKIDKNDSTVSADINKTSKFLVFKDRIDDNFGGTGIPTDSSNYIAEYNATTSSESIKDLCVKLDSTDIDFVSLLVVAIDNANPQQANCSDISRIDFIPMKNAHVLKVDKTVTESQTPSEYRGGTDQCTWNPSYSDGTTDPNSGINLKATISLADKTISLAYKNQAGTTLKAGILPKYIFVSLPTDTTKSIARIGYVDAYIGKHFFVEYDGKVYKGKFLDTTEQDLHDDSQSPYTLTLVNTSQKLLK